MTKRELEPSAVQTDIVLVPPLFSITKSLRQLLVFEFAALDVFPGQNQFLTCFIGTERLSTVALAERLSIRPSTASKMVDIMVGKGWVVRTKGRDDRRKAMIELTDAGRRVREAVQAIEAELDAELRRSISQDAEALSVLTELDTILTDRLRRLR